MRIRLMFFVLFPILIVAQNNNCSCCIPPHTDFDFWVGTWAVTNADGTSAGTNTITKEENGCVLRENWTSAQAGFTGTSINFYNRQSEQWEQLWVDNSGNHLKLKGNRAGNQMILQSDEFLHSDGEKYINRITWTLYDDGTVNQLWVMVKDTEVKQVLFDGLYKKSAN